MRLEDSSSGLGAKRSRKQTQDQLVVGLQPFESEVERLGKWMKLKRTGQSETTAKRQANQSSPMDIMDGDLGLPVLDLGPFLGSI